MFPDVAFSRTKLRFGAFLFALIAAWPLASCVAAASGDRKGPPKTHRLLTIALPSPAAWLTPVPDGGASSKNTRLYALTKDGGLYALHPGGKTWTAKRLDKVPRIAALVPPVLIGENRIAAAGEKGSLLIVKLPEGQTTLIRPSAAPSPLSRPAALGSSTLAAVGLDGSLMTFRKKPGSSWIESQRIPAAEAMALRDGILTAADLDGDGRKELIVPAAPSARYDHGVLGDAIEPTEVRAYRLTGERLRHLSSYKAKAFAAFEAIGATAGDLDGDGKEDILITQSDRSDGAVHFALGLRNGNLVRQARGEAIGQGYRWSHLLGAFDLPPHGKRVLAIETPHLSGYLLALRMVGGRLLEQARRPGFTTHAIGSRNVWEFAVMRREREAEIVLQEVGRRSLTALALGEGRWAARWSIPLAAPVGSNLAAADFNGDGRDDLVFAGKDGRIQVLLSR